MFNFIFHLALKGPFDLAFPKTQASNSCMAQTQNGLEVD